jgi:hypothetical protein
MRLVSSASVIARERLRTPAAELSNSVIVPPGCQRASCWKWKLVPRPIRKSLRSPPSRHLASML